MVEKDYRPSEVLPQIAQVHVDVPGLMPDIINAKGEMLKQSNLGEKLPFIHDTLEGIEPKEHKTFYQKIIEDIHSGKKSAIYTITGIGVLTFFVATVAGFEFGIRHGKDLRHLDSLLQPFKHNTRE